MPSWILAIDFGTSYTVAAAKVGDRAPEIVEIGGERRMPSVVMVDPEGQIYVGRTAEDLSVTHPGSTLRALKNRLGDQTPAILGGRPHQVVALVAALLRDVYNEVVTQYGSAPAEVRLTHPATWNQPRVNRLVEAAAKAGLPAPLLVPEPVAAALSYAADVGVEPGRPIAVYDLGGGTFDSAIVTARDGGFAVVGRPGGDQHIGGELFDELVVNHVGSTIDPETWERIQVGDDALWRQVGAALRNEARKAKESLSAHPYVNMLVPLPQGLHQVHFTRDEFDAMIRPYIGETLTTMRRCIDEAGVTAQQLAGVSLVGGSSRMPLVEQMMHEAFPMVSISRRGDPKATVAAGATLAERPASGAPGVWRSPVTQEASPGTARQRVRLAPPPISEPPALVQGASAPPLDTPPLDTPLKAPSLPSTGAGSDVPAAANVAASAPASGPGSAPPPPPTPDRPPAREVPPPPVAPAPVIGGQLHREPEVHRSRRATAVLVGALLAVAIAVGIFFVIDRSDDGPSKEEESSQTDDRSTDGSGASGTAVTGSSEGSATQETTQESATQESATEETSTLGSSTDESTGATTADTGSTGPSGSTVDLVGEPVGTHLVSLVGHTAEVLSAEFSPDGRWLVTAGLDGAPIVWNLADASRVSVLRGHTGEVYSAVFSPDGATVATAGDDRTVRLWDARTGRAIAVFSGHAAVVYQVRFSPDGGSLLSASADGTARLWDITSRTQAAVFTGASEALYFAEFSPNGEQIVGGGQDDTVLIWSVFAANDPLYLHGHTADVQVGSFSPDGSLVLSGSDDARIRVWDPATGDLVYDLGNIEGGVASATFSHDGARLMASGADNTAALWDVASGRLLGDLAGHSDIVYSAAFSPDDDLVVTASADGTAKLWDVSPGTPIGVEVATLELGAPSPGAVFNPDGTLVATVDAGGGVEIWAS